MYFMPKGLKGSSTHVLGDLGVPVEAPMIEMSFPEGRREPQVLPASWRSMIVVLYTLTHQISQTNTHIYTDTYICTPKYICTYICHLSHFTGFLLSITEQIQI